MNDVKTLTIRTFFIGFIIVILLNFYTLKPLFNALLVGGIIGGATYPLYEYFQKSKLKLRSNQSAYFTLFLIVSLIFLPLIYVIIQMGNEGVTLYVNIKENILNGKLQNFFFGDGNVAVYLKSLAAKFNIDYTSENINNMLLSKIKEISKFVVTQLNSVIGNTFAFLFNFFIMIIFIAFIFLDGKQFKESLLSIVPLMRKDEELILSKFNQMNYVNLVCNGIGGIIQGVFAGIIMWFIGVESVFMWTTIMIILAFIPLVGISVVTIPMSLYYILTGDYASGGTLLVLSSGVAIWTENWFKPKFIGHRVEVNSIIMMLYVIAGMSVFGILGIFYGPIICTLLITFTEIFRSNYKDFYEVD